MRSDVGIGKLIDALARRRNQVDRPTRGISAHSRLGKLVAALARDDLICAAIYPNDQVLAPNRPSAKVKVRRRKGTRLRASRAWANSSQRSHASPREAKTVRDLSPALLDHLALGSAHAHPERPGTTESYLTAALLRSEEEDDLVLAAHALVGLGRLTEERGRLLEANSHYRAALAVSNATNSEDYRLIALLGLAHVSGRLGHKDDERGYLKQAREAVENLDFERRSPSVR